MVVMTYPLIGNYGVNFEDVESERIQVAAFVVREYQNYPSNFRSTGTLADYLKRQGVLGCRTSGYQGADTAYPQRGCNAGRYFYPGTGPRCVDQAGQ